MLLKGFLCLPQGILRGFGIDPQYQTAATAMIMTAPVPGTSNRFMHNLQAGSSAAACDGCVQSLGEESPLQCSEQHLIRGNSPAHYEGQQLKAKGVASDVAKIPLVGFKYYTLNDQGSQIMVAVKEDLPMMNRQVIVIGVVEKVMIIVKESIGLHPSEAKRVASLF